MNKLIKEMLHPLVGFLNYRYLRNYYSHISSTSEDTIRHSERVLILAPHQDDETIGLGATIIKLKGHNAHISLLYMTSGVQLPDDDINTQIGSIRRAEAISLVDMLGIDQMDNLDYNIMTLMDRVDDLAEDIGKCLAASSYDRIYTTALSEMHPDHVATYLALIKALGPMGTYDDVPVYMYEVNNSLQDGSINIVETFDKDTASKKLAAFDIFKSQVNISFETVDMIQRAKSSIIEDGSYGAEVFYRMKARDFAGIDTSYEDFPYFGMKNATNFMRLIKNYKHNASYRDKIKGLFGSYK